MRRLARVRGRGNMTRKRFVWLAGSTAVAGEVTRGMGRDQLGLPRIRPELDRRSARCCAGERTQLHPTGGES